MSDLTAAPPRHRVGVDPRIRRRQVEIRRAEGRRRLLVVLGVLAALALAGVAWAVTRSPLLDVDRVTVLGADRSGAAAVRSAAAVGRHQPMVDVDRAGAARRVEALPWVLRAEVRRSWPATVRIRVTERTARAVTSAVGGGWALVDPAGRVLDRVPAAPPGLPLVEGVPQAGAPGSTVPPATADPLRVAVSLPPGLAPRVASVAAGARGVELHLRPTGVVVLGAADAVGAKLGAALTVLGAVDGRTVATLDVRIPQTPVLTRR
ncbi:MAG: cell division protein FtsQ/DivIB [Acidimicrobiales bacterium]